MIVDCHTHVASDDVFPAGFIDGWVATVASLMPRKISPPEQAALRAHFRRGLTSDASCDGLVAEMDAAGIDKAALLIIDFGCHYPYDFAELERVYELHAEINRRHRDRFMVFAGVDPRRGQAGLDLFERSIRDWGFAGMKLYPPCGYSPSDERLGPYYEICAARSLPVLTHVGPTSSTMPFTYTAPELVDEAAYRFPKVNIILGHAAVTRHHDAALLAEHRPNIFLDLSGFQSARSRGELTDILRFHRRRGLMRKLLFGTDWPIHRFSGKQAAWVDTFTDYAREGVLTEVECADLLCNNFLRLIEA